MTLQYLLNRGSCVPFISCLTSKVAQTPNRVLYSSSSACWYKSTIGPGSTASCHIIWVLGMESCWCPGYQCPKLFMYPPECTGAPLAAMLMSHSEHGEEEDGGGGARWSPSGPQGPFFMIFLYLDRLFWNHIFTWRMKKKREGVRTPYFTIFAGLLKIYRLFALLLF